MGNHPFEQRGSLLPGVVQGEGVKEAVRGGVHPAWDDPRRKQPLSFLSVHSLGAGQMGRGPGQSHCLLLCLHIIRSRGCKELCSFGNHRGKCFSWRPGKGVLQFPPVPGRSRQMGLPQFPSLSYSDFQTLTCAPPSPQAGALVRRQPTPL